MIKLTTIMGGFVIFPIIVLALTAFWIWMLIDCAHHETDHTRKTGWLMIIALTHWLGAIVYFLVGRRHCRRIG